MKSPLIDNIKPILEFLRAVQMLQGARLYAGAERLLADCIAELGNAIANEEVDSTQEDPPF